MSACTPGDVDGDLYPDIVVVSWTLEAMGLEVGTAYLFRGMSGD